MKIYIAGPMTGYEDFNFPAFHAAAAEIRRQGHDPLNPATSFEGSQTYPYAMYIREAVRMVAMADAIVMLPGWENSKGALTEAMIAVTIGIPFLEFGSWSLYEGYHMNYGILAHWIDQLPYREEIDAESRIIGEDEVGKIHTSESFVAV